MDPTKQNSPMTQPEETMGFVQQTARPTNPPVPGLAQPATPEPMPQGEAKKTNFKNLIVVIIVVVLAIATVIAGLIFGGVIKFGDDSPVPEQSGGVSPTPELAKSVCEKYGGDYSVEEASRYYCKNNGSSQPFDYIITFSDQERIDEFRKLAKTSPMVDDITILENSDEFIKIYASPSETNNLESYVFSAVYKDVIIELEVLDGVFGENLLAELGFPDRSRETSYTTLSTNAMRSFDDSRSDVEYRDDLAHIISLMAQFQANNRGQLPTISNGSLVGFDEYLKDVDEEYSIVGFESFEETEFAKDDTSLYDIPSNQIYAFYYAECSNGVLLATERPRKVALVHSKADHSGYHCISN